ncbi:MAG TPA: sigma-54 dependent transcriptional regulator [Candidatus Binataceae bacterium]|nr:sigma-54 dependent transcriptional regulator [Candidatus Binataceae bacterium]
MDASENVEAKISPDASDIVTEPERSVSLDRLTHGSERIAGMMVRSVQVRKIFQAISRLSAYKATVLIHGESGTGKELVARALHTLGPLPNSPFVIFNCSNLVESLAESQLFGHVRGAFTDAREDSQGYFRSANGGTLFLDEIGELPLKLQPKLLRAVETLDVQPVGSAHSYKVDVRLVAATNRDLRSMVKAGQFRDDLYYRLNTAAIYVPPLRDRREAIPAFAGYFIEYFSAACGKRVERIEAAALEALCAYQWPGNVRELAHAIESAVILSEGDCLRLRELPAQLVDGSGAAMISQRNVASANGHEFQNGAPNGAASAQPDFLLDDVIKKTLVRSLDETGGNRRRAAGLLGVSRSTLYRMLVRYGIEETPPAGPVA